MTTVPLPKKTPWYSLENLVPYSDLVAALGAVLLIGGIAAIYWPAAMIVGGALLMWMAWKMSTAE